MDIGYFASEFGKSGVIRLAEKFPHIYVHMQLSGEAVAALKAAGFAPYPSAEGMTLLGHDGETFLQAIRPIYQRMGEGEHLAEIDDSLHRLNELRALRRHRSTVLKKSVGRISM